MKSVFVYLLFLLSVCRAGELNDVNIGDKKFGIISVSVANLRENPAHSAQLVDQEIMGYSIKLLKRKDNWYQAQTEYGYVGWITDKSFCRADEAAMKIWKDCDKVIVTKIFAMVYSEPNEKSLPITNVVLNVLLKSVGQVDAEWTKIQTPDGRGGFIRTDSIAQMPRKKLSGEQLRQSLVRTAKNMMGIPYLWGGKSSVGCDCSGFTQTVFRADGVSILRDAGQQVSEGAAVDYAADFSNVEAGDLLFFGRDKITHVGMSLGGAEFIHQSGDVHINSLDPNAANYSPLYRKILKSIRNNID